MTKLAERECVPCKGGVPPLPPERVAELLVELNAQDDGWLIEHDYHLMKTYTFKNFAEAMGFANEVAAIAEEQNHHPDLHIAWGKCTVEVWTHKINGLTESDFIFAAKAGARLRR